MPLNPSLKTCWELCWRCSSQDATCKWAHMHTQTNVYKWAICKWDRKEKGQISLACWYQCVLPQLVHKAAIEKESKRGTCPARVSQGGAGLAHKRECHPVSVTEFTVSSEHWCYKGLQVQAWEASHLGQETLRDSVSCSTQDPGKPGIVPVT